MADGGYRDDREALRAKVEELQQEIATLRQASAKMTLPKGPAKKCPACLASGEERDPRFFNDAYYWNVLAPVKPCTPRKRTRIGWFRRCTEPGEHLHEHCRVCGLDWLTAFAGE